MYEEADIMRKIGYVRVSTKDQNPERQISVMHNENISNKYIFIDKYSGKDFERPAYKRMIRQLKKDDLLVVKSIDRLGRNYAEILDEWRKITRDIGANIKILDMPLLNTSIDHDNLTGIFISDLVLQILAYVAETERTFIRQRQAEGIAIAKANGVRFGNKRLEIPESFDKYYELWDNNKLSVREAASLAGMSASTFYRRCKERKSVEIQAEKP